MASPNLNKMDFFDALPAVLKGQRITRIDWNDASIYGFLSFQGLLSLRRDGENHSWIVSEGDMVAEDWVVLDPDASVN